MRMSLISQSRHISLTLFSLSFSLFYDFFVPSLTNPNGGPLTTTTVWRVELSTAIRTAGGVGGGATPPGGDGRSDGATVTDEQRDDAGRDDHGAVVDERRAAGGERDADGRPHLRGGEARTDARPRRQGDGARLPAEERREGQRVGHLRRTVPRSAL